jgi:hypothetical protein
MSPLGLVGLEYTCQIHHHDTTALPYAVFLKVLLMSAKGPRQKTSQLLLALTLYYLLTVVSIGTKSGIGTQHLARFEISFRDTFFQNVNRLTTVHD